MLNGLKLKRLKSTAFWALKSLKVMLAREKNNLKVGWGIEMHNIYPCFTHSGFARNLTAEKIIGATNDPGELYFLIKVSSMNLFIQFYSYSYSFLHLLVFICSVVLYPSIRPIHPFIHSFIQ